MPSATWVGGIYVFCNRLRGRGRIGPCCAAEVREGKVGFFIGHEVGVGSERQLWVLMSQLIGSSSLPTSGARGSAVTALEDGLGRISALASADASATAALAVGFAGAGNDL